MAIVIQGLFFNPPIAVARVGGSDIPQPAYTWTDVEGTRTEDTSETALKPAWSLHVMDDGTAIPFLPNAVQFRDGPLIRPVCPFFELWLLVGEQGSLPDAWTQLPVNAANLAQFGVTPAQLQFSIDACNRKAARRTNNPSLRFGTFPPLTISATDHRRHEIKGRNPPNAQPKLIPARKHIRLGYFQVLQLGTRTPAAASGVFDVQRVRFTPGKGHVYGPRNTAKPMNANGHPAVTPNHAFLNPNAGWAGTRDTRMVEPPDTYDGEERGDQQSVGTVDDTCDARIGAVLTLANGREIFRAHANVMVGPPDFAPDHRPFLSAADELNDRIGAPARLSAGLSDLDRDRWVEDLFERIFETLSLMNVDYWRNERGIGRLPAARLRAKLLPGDGLSQPARAMGGRDQLRDDLYRIPASDDNNLLPVSKHARERHRTLSDIIQLRDFVSGHRGRLRQLVRGPFELESIEDSENTTMRMPPFMRSSNAEPLTLTQWQYDLLMQWVHTVETAAPQPVSDRVEPLSTFAGRRLEQVMQLLADGGDGR